MIESPQYHKFIAYFERLPSGKLLTPSKMSLVLHLGIGNIIKYLKELEREDKVMIVKHNGTRRDYIKY